MALMYKQWIGGASVKISKILLWIPDTVILDADGLEKFLVGARMVKLMGNQCITLLRIKMKTDKIRQE